jgi:hypothetical protein
MSLETPEKIRILQRKLYRKAEPAYRFYVLYDKSCRADILCHADRLARANAGVDGLRVEQIEELVSKTYPPDPVRRVMIPKANGGERALGIATIRDRVVETAAKLVLEPIFEDNASVPRAGRWMRSRKGPLPGLHRGGRRRPLRLLRDDPARRAAPIGRSSCRGWC